ncbi:MAG: OAM dimerization domain-containing protein, partial [Phycicoccus sp.]
MTTSSVRPVATASLPEKPDRPVGSTAATTGPLVRPYGDTTGDGMVQVSFTLPLPHDKRAEGAALQLAAKMGMEP